MTMADKETEETVQDVGQKEAWAANIKKLFEGSLDVTERGRLAFDLIAMNSVTAIGSINSAMANHAQNVVKHSDALMEQLIEASALARDRIWNVDEQGYTVEKILRAPFWQDLAQAIAIAVATELGKNKE